MKYMAAAEFKAKCLKVMEEVAATGEEVVVTKRGTPVVRIVPPPPADPQNYWGWGAGTVFVVGDVLAPMETTGWTLDGEPWDEVFPDPDRASTPCPAPVVSPPTDPERARDDE